MRLLFLVLILASCRAPDARDSRFGVAVSSVNGASALDRQLARLGAGSWYTYALDSDDGWPAGRAFLMRTGRGGPKLTDERIAALARARPGAAWLIGNEPNLPDQDGADPEVFAREFAHDRQVVKAADPGALIVGPNVQNVDWACPSCEGMTPGRAFLDAWRAAHRALYGGEPELDAFGLHVYDLDWDHLPMTDPSLPQRELRAARAYVEGVPEWRGKPIWVTEMGVVWAYPGYAVEGPRLRPTGNYDEAGTARYVETLVRYLRDDPDGVRAARWFVFSNAPYAEPFATGPAGLSLFAGPGPEAPFTQAGTAYAALAARRP